jgi:hypothetical protein
MDCTPEVHVATLRRWDRLYGAEVVGMLPDLMELQVARPPRSRTAALALAREHLAYCPDVVVQGTMTLEALAASLVNAPVWHFWWD